MIFRTEVESELVLFGLGDDSLRAERSMSTTSRSLVPPSSAAAYDEEAEQSFEGVNQGHVRTTGSTGGSKENGAKAAGATPVGIVSIDDGEFLQTMDGIDSSEFGAESVDLELHDVQTSPKRRHYILQTGVKRGGRGEGGQSRQEARLGAIAAASDTNDDGNDSNPSLALESEV
eukprot:m.232774 g.232774  ORF g.232774 m.232774 type:complete len:174 (+) comp15238_c0_seq1:274-795(+)